MTIREAKARLHALVEAAERGEQIVLMRGSKLVAAIVAISANDFELGPRLSDPQAERLWRQLEAERGSGASVVMESPEEAVAYLSGKRPGGRSRRAFSGVKPPPGRRRR